MKTFLAVALLFCSGTLIAHDDMLVFEGCGQSEKAAKSNAKKNAEASVYSFQLDCEKNGGSFSIQYQDGYCVPYDPTNLACPTSCSLVAIFECETSK